MSNGTPTPASRAPANNSSSSTDAIVGKYLREGGSAPVDSTIGTSGTTYWETPVRGPGIGSMTADRYLNWVNSRYTPRIAQANTTGEALGAYMNDPASNALAVRAARVWYAGNSSFQPQWAQNWLKDNIIPSAVALGISPYQLLSDVASGRVTTLPTDGSSGGSGSYGGGGGGGGGGGFSTQQTIDLTSPTQARGLLMQTIQGALGRNPNDNEYSEFLKILNESQTANPQVVTASGSTVTRSGGVDPSMLALDYAQSQDDYKDRQANQYYDVFLNALARGA